MSVTPRRLTPRGERDPEVLAQAVVGVVEQLTRTYLFERDERVDEVADSVVSFCLRGLAG